MGFISNDMKGYKYHPSRNANGKEAITCYDCSAMQIDSHTPTFLPKASVEIGPTSKSKESQSIVQNGIFMAAAL